MRTAIYKAAALICVTICLAACQPASAPRIVSAGSRPVAANTKTIAPPPVPGADLKTLGWKLQAGTKQTLADYKGKVVVLDFWATYCPPCLEEIPHLVDLQNKYGDNGLRVLGLNVGGVDDRPLVGSFARRLKIQYDLGEPDTELVDALFNGTDIIPQTFVFDRGGKLVKNVSGYSTEVRDDLDAAVQQALAN